MKKIYLKNIEEKDYVDEKRKLYDDNIKIIENLKENKIFLSRVDLENDLDECMHDRLRQVLGLSKKKSPIKYLQEKNTTKWLN